MPWNIWVDDRRRVCRHRQRRVHRPASDTWRHRLSCQQRRCPELDNNDDCDADDSEGPSEITIKDARQGLATFINFLEQDGSSISDTGDNTETLDFLWKLYNATNARALWKSRQTKLTDFFKVIVKCSTALSVCFYQLHCVKNVLLLQCF